MHSADYAVARCPSVCLSVRQSHAGILSTHIFTVFFWKPGSHTILVFPHQERWQYFDEDPPNRDVECKGVWKNHDFQLISHFISKMMQDRAIVTMEGEYETAPKLSNGTSLNDLQ